MYSWSDRNRHVSTNQVKYRFIVHSGSNGRGYMFECDHAERIEMYPAKFLQKEPDRQLAVPTEF